MRVAFLGPTGTFTEEALRASAPGVVEELAYPTVYETVMAVQWGEADRAIVPIENSIEGSVTATLDALAGEAADVRIVEEVVHPISHSLIAARVIAGIQTRMSPWAAVATTDKGENKVWKRLADRGYSVKRPGHPALIT